MGDLLLLGGHHDPVLGAVAHCLCRSRPEVPVRHYRLEDLASAGWTHRLGRSPVTSRTTFPDGYDPTGQTSLVLNRLQFEPSLLYTAMKPVDRDYARSEFLALLMSWIAGVEGTVVNRTTRLGLAGPALRPWQWLAAAQSIGLPPYPSLVGNSARRFDAVSMGGGWVARADLLRAVADPALAQAGPNHPCAFAPTCEEAVRIDVIGDEIVAPTGASVPADRLHACRTLARSISADLLAITLGRPVGVDGWHFVSADPVPPDMAEPAMRTLCDWLSERL